MKKIYIILTYIILLTFIQLPLQAQNIHGTLSGTIKTSDGNPAPFVTVMVKELNKGTAATENGTFQIKGIKQGTYTLKISFAGMATQEKTISISAGKNTVIDITLTENASQLAEIQINGRKSINQKKVTVGKSGITVRDLPQAVQILDSTIIADQQANRLSDVMKNVNGIAMGENRGSVNESFFARGYTLGANNVLKNGARSSSGGSPEASTLESVEVLKGSAALLYGGVTGGAVVNLVTKKPKFTSGGEVSFRAGSYGQYKPTLDVYGPASKTVAYRIIATKENADSYRDVVKSDRFYVNPSLLFNISPKTELIVQGDYLKSNFTPDFGIGTINNQIVDIGRDTYVNTPWAYNNTNTTTAQVNLNHRFNDVWKLNFVSAFQSYNRNYFSAERPFANAAGVAARGLTRSKSQEYTYNQQINITGALYTGAIKHTVLAGADADQSRATAYGFKYDNNTTSYAYGNINLMDPTTFNNRTDIPDTRIYQDTFTPIYRMGAFVQDLVELSEQFKVLAGIRYTRQITPRTTTNNYETGETTLSNNSLGKSKIENAFSPKFGLIYQPVKSSSVYVSYASNFTSNTGTDIYLAPMAPSIIDQYEAGIKNDFLNGKLSVNVTAYRIINNRFAQTALFKADGTANGDATIKEFSGKTASDGLEVDISGKLSKGLYFIAGYSYNYFRYTQTAAAGVTEGERIVGSTPHTANGTVFYTFTKGQVKGLKLGLSGFYTGRRNSGYNSVKQGNARGPVIPLTDFATFDVSAGYTYKKLSILGKISNLTNEINYLVHENYSVNPIAPRMLSTTLAYRF